MPFSVCPECGAWEVGKKLSPADGNWVIASCSSCGGAQPVLRLPLFVVSGARGVGKTTVMHELLHTLPECVVLESDILWGTVPPDGPNDYRSYYRVWLRMIVAIAQAGKPVLLSGTALPDPIETLPERQYVGPIHYLALVCDVREQRARLRARPAWRASGTEEFLGSQGDFNAHLIENAADMAPPMTTLDTTGTSPGETAGAVRRWIQERL